MKTLIVGGSGMIGSHIAQHLSVAGHTVSIGSRTPPAGEGAYPVVIGDYVARSFTREQLAGFDAIVFAAGQDVRHTRGVAPDDAFWRATQSEGVPAFAALARDAGVSRFVQIGSYYHEVMPALVETNPYVRARMIADRDTRALSTDGFIVATINPPSVVGAVPGPSLERFRGLVAWARGARPDIPDFAPRGGTNYISADALAEAVLGALDQNDDGKAYLVGDANLSYREFFQKIFVAADSDRVLEERDEPHPMLPDPYIVHGRGVTLAYEPDDAERRRLGYWRGDIDRAIEAIVAKVDG